VTPSRLSSGRQIKKRTIRCDNDNKGWDAVANLNAVYAFPIQSGSR
jgi:hypothetical protein